MNEVVGVRRNEVIPPAGLTVLFDPDKSSLDIVFIHGFTGHPERTWTHKRGDAKDRNEDNDGGEPPSKVRRLNPFSRSLHGGNSNTAVYWPRDLVPVTIPYARVLTYGYDTHLRHCFDRPVSRNTVYDIAWDFLLALEAERRSEPSRPILFIAHSLGGIIVKEMLRRSSGCHGGQSHLRGVFDSTVGIMFFGTPHGGADPRGFLRHIAEAVIKAAGVRVNEQILNTLLPSAERLKELRDEFSPMALQQDWIIHSFQEELGVMGLNGHKVVEDASSYLNFPSIEIAQHIGQNHMNMCRFTGLDDVEYKKVAAALHRMTSMVSNQSRMGGIPSLNKEQRRMLLDSMRFDQIYARQLNVKRAHTKTCQWLLKQSEYLDWLDVAKLHEHHGFLWIKGKPGTGKSTMMKFALSNSPKIMKDRIIISFFFNARGADLEKSTIGMYRSLLVQLLQRLPELQCVFDSLGFATWDSSSHHQWSIESLKDLFGQAIQILGQSSVMCFIDALDECNEREIRDLMGFFQHIGELTISAGIRFQVCFSSRHYPHITIRKGLSIVLEGQEGHIQDITSYIDSELKVGHSKLAEQIRVELQEKASGVFMWVVLVVGILNKDHDGGRIHALRQRLQDIPSDLHELFRDILTRDKDNKNELLLCVQWLLFAGQPLKPEELYFAILSGIEPQNLFRWDSDEIPIDTIKRFILNSSKGLAEITKAKDPCVQFIHESVRDFLLKENGLRAIWSDLGSNFQVQSHERLKQCCLNYMGIEIATHLNIGTPLPIASSEEGAALRHSATKKFPFLQYAVKNVLHHADTAGGGGINQKDFVQSFRLAYWINLNNLFARHQIRRHTPKASLLYILAESNMPNLIRVHPDNLSCFEVGDERYGPPIFAALATGSHDAVQILYEIQAEIQVPSSPLHDLCKQYCQERSNRSIFGRNFTFSRRRTIISYAEEHGDEILLAFLLETGEYIPYRGDSRTPLSRATWNGHEAGVKLLLNKGAKLEAQDNDGQTPLSRAAREGHKATVKLLLNKGAKLEAQDNYSQTPLSWATWNGHEAIVKLLLDKGAKLEAQDNNGRTPLSRATRNGHEAIVKLLLDKGTKLEAQDNNGRTPLSWAARNGHEAGVKLLLDKGAKLEAQDNDGWTPLSWAAREGHEAIVKLLLDKGAKLEAQDNDGRTPLSRATWNGHEAVVKLLLDKGAKLEAQDNNGRTPLSWAAWNGHEAIVKLLLDKGTKLEAQDNDGRTPLSWAARRGHEAIVKLLLDKSAKLEAQDNDGQTPLSWAAREGHEAIVKLLLDKGAKLEAQDNDGQTPLSWAAQNRHKAAVKLLLDKGAKAKDS